MFCSLPLVQQQIPCSVILFNNNVRVRVLSSYFTIMYVFSSLSHIMQQFSCSVLIFYTFSVLYLILCNNAQLPMLFPLFLQQCKIMQQCSCYFLLFYNNAHFLFFTSDYATMLILFLQQCL